ncbi:LpqB family beta-propeller domain-containing protein [Aeromicrobium sp. NPDC092404]|uniref:LpqB family beta-propeller domain-containing protein n=1 Tax=Aeromicrobium sp. NPDC092404 TaxID=3154976 RepID=UPI00343B5208
MTSASRTAAPATARRSALAVIALLVVSACAGIPSSGPVSKVADDGGLGESTVRYSPARPAEGASPQQIVRGYLDAMLAYPVSTGTATAFLTPEGEKGWNPSAGVRVYSLVGLSGPTLAAGESGEGGETTDKTRDPVEVETRLVLDARLDQQGHYTRQAGPGNVTYRLERVKGEWRITNPQDGLLVNRKFFDDYYRSFNIFYFDRPGRRVVPDPVHAVVGEQLATTLVTSLARGPATSARGATRTYVPRLRSLRPSVPVSDDGIADVEFTTDFAAMSESAQNHLSAQIVWTLRQVPDVSSVRLAGGTTVLSNSDRTTQDVSSWRSFGPRGARGHAYAIADDRVVQIDESTVKRLSGAWGQDARGAVAVGVSDAGVAGVLRGRNLVRVTNRQGTDARTFGGSQLLTPRWDDDGSVWLLDRQAGRTRARLVTGDRIRTLGIGGLARLDVRTFALSPDGSRYAATVRGVGGTSLRVGWVERDTKDRVLGLGDPTSVFTPATAPRSVTWSSGTDVSYLAETQTGRQVHTTAIDGSSTSGGLSRDGALLPDVGATDLAVGTGETPARYATDARRRLWFLPAGQSWQLLSARGVTGLTYGS